MNRAQLIVLLVVVCLTGCARQRSVICFAPADAFQPKSGAELLQEFNSQMPFRVSSNEFVCKAKSSGLVGWAVLDNAKQKEAAKQSLASSKTLRLLQVEALTPEFKEAVKRNWRQSQTVAPRDQGPEPAP